MVRICLSTTAALTLLTTTSAVSAFTPAFVSRARLSKRFQVATMSTSLKPYIETLIAGERHLTSDETEAAFGAILSGADEIQVGALLTLLRAREDSLGDCRHGQGHEQSLQRS